MYYLELLFFTALTLQLIYFILFVIAFSRKTKTTSSLSPATETPLSIVVCAHDELENLKILVPELLKQEYAAFEVIVVNDRSNDDTLDWLLTETKKHSQLRMVHVDRTPDHINGKKYALTLGIRAATHDWIVLTDADCRPKGSHWLRQLSEEAKDNTQIILGYSPYQKKAGWLNLFIRFETLITGLQYLSFALLKMPYMGVGRNMAYRKSLFMENKGFNNMLSYTGGDDDLFVNKYAHGRNTRVVLGEQSLVYSIPKNTLGEFFQQKVRHLAAGKKYKPGHRFLLGIFMLSWLMSLLLGICLLIFSLNPLVVTIALAVRLMAFTITLHIAQKRMGEGFELWFLLVLDIIYIIYYLSTGTAALLTKKIRWKN